MKDFETKCISTKSVRKKSASKKGTNTKKKNWESTSTKTRKSHEQFIQEAREKLGSDYEVASKYKGAQIDIEILHKTCGRVHTITPNKILSRGYKCGRCYGGVRRTQEEFCEDLSEASKGEIELVSSYINTGTKITVKHIPCGYEWSTHPLSLIHKKTGCPRCNKNGDRDRLSIEEVKDRAKERGYEVLTEEYLKASKKLVFKCPEGHTFLMTWNNFQRGQNCPICSKENKVPHNKLNEEIVEDRIEEQGFTLIRWLEAYDGVDTRILVQCEHGHVTESSYAIIMASEYGCRECTESKGERRIRHYLEANNITFQTQYKFEECRYKRKLPFDFAVFDSEGKVAYLIEYDGEHHFKPARYSNDKKKMMDKLKAVQKRDNIKTDFCSDNDYILVRIPYFKFESIEKILDEALINLVKTNSV